MGMRLELDVQEEHQRGLLILDAIGAESTKLLSLVDRARGLSQSKEVSSRDYVASAVEGSGLVHLANGEGLRCQVEDLVVRRLKTDCDVHANLRSILDPVWDRAFRLWARVFPVESDVGTTPGAYFVDCALPTWLTRLVTDDQDGDCEWALDELWKSLVGHIWTVNRDRLEAMLQRKALPGVDVANLVGDAHLLCTRLRSKRLYFENNQGLAPYKLACNVCQGVLQTEKRKWARRNKPVSGEPDADDDRDSHGEPEGADAEGGKHDSQIQDELIDDVGSQHENSGSGNDDDSHIRRRGDRNTGGRRIDEHPDESALTPSSQAVQNEENKQKEQLKEQLKAAMSKLKPIHQQILHEVYTLGKSQADVAREREVPEGRINMLVFRAREALRKLLRAE